MLKRLPIAVFLFALVAFTNTALYAQCNELFFSEYVEGNFNNKAMEIYNPTNQPIDLSGYRIIRWSNGNNIYDPVASVQLSGTIGAKDVVVVVIDKQDCTLAAADTCVFQELKNKADLFVCPVYEVCNALYHNGNDAMSLNKNDGVSTQFGATGTFVDIFGLIGEDPGQSWTNTAPYTQSAGGAYWTRDKTLIRKNGIAAGVTTNPGIPYTGAWNPTAQWDTLSRNTFTHLGWHSCQCGDAPNSVPAIVSNKVSIYPNPAKDVLHLQCTQAVIASVEIYNLLGELVLTEKVAQQQTTISLQGWVSGAYFVKTTFNDHTVSYDKLLIH
ncbi:MAG TPA: T9SS type A sorting domain-containing protein [Chitinophagales bacterium]|nr:T9SS type A sorting domain-containing protein [Chitinophagales bacterium]HRK28822.1 T9SS type A sorting domain-containing protein [Chitinophagales bacterium]